MKMVVASLLLVPNLLAFGEHLGKRKGHGKIHSFTLFMCRNVYSFRFIVSVGNFVQSYTLIMDRRE